MANDNSSRAMPRPVRRRLRREAGFGWALSPRRSMRSIRFNAGQATKKLIINLAFVSFFCCMELLFTPPVLSDDKINSNSSIECQGKFDKRAPTQNDIEEVFKSHEKWIKSYRNPYIGQGGEQANFCGADLRKLDLKNFNLNAANLRRSDLSDLDLTGKDLWTTLLEGADLRRANLTNTIAREAQMQHTILIETKLQGAKLGAANLTGAVYEPAADGLPNIRDIAAARGLEFLTFRDNKSGLIELRKAFRNAGYREQERKITFAIKHTEQEMAPWPERFFSLALFEWPSAWGLYPGRPLKILGTLMIICTLIYIVPLSSTKSARPTNSAIYKIWAPDRIRTRTNGSSFEADFQEVLSIKIWKVPLVAFYFSVLSAFHFGWRDLNVGTWISRIQPQEYSLQATGWVRVVSGLQSLVSIYLLALWALVYFGRPFDG